MRALTPDGVEIAFRCHGGAGAQLLLTHANGFCGEAWRPVAGRLADAFEVWSLDFRGHGASGRPADGRFDWAGTGLDVLAVLDEIDQIRATAGDSPRPWVGAGHSMGGAALLLAQQARPRRFAALWLFEPIVFPPSFGVGGANPLAEGARRRRPGFASRAEARANYSSKPPMQTFDPEALDGFLDGGLRVAADGSVVLACVPEDEAQLFELGGRHGAWDHLAEVDVPVTVVAGSTEQAGPAHVAAAIVDALPGGALESHPEMGHFAPFEDPDPIAASIRRALQPPPAGGADDPPLSGLDRTIPS